MKLRNRHGTAVDPVPFVVAVGVSFLVLFSYGPGYLLAFGVRVATALAVVATGWVVLVALSYHQLVWTARPELRGEVPAAVRFRRLFYAVLVGIAIIVLLLLPLLAL